MNKKYFVVYYVWDTFRGFNGPMNVIINKHPLKWLKEDKDSLMDENGWDSISISWWQLLEEDYDK